LPIAKSRDRMPPLPRGKMTAAQKKARQELVAGRRGELSGPFIPSLRSPEFMTRLQKLGEYLRYDNFLKPRLREMVILLTAREWTQEFEWGVHCPLALKNGLKPEIVAAIAEGRRPLKMAQGEEIVWDFFVELLRKKSVSDATYARAVKKFGEQGVVDLTGTIGYYSTLAMIMNVARTPAGQSALARFPD
jgi:4-carboxymuconolactone decarboxylase